MNLAVAVAATNVLAGCGGTGSSAPSIPRAWQKVDNCLEQHASFAGNVAYNHQNSGPGWHGSLNITVDGASGFIATAYRFKSHAAAAAGEKGIGPPGPTVHFYGPVALEINPGTTRSQANAIENCFTKEAS